jgi:hypothetical protein
MVAEFVDENKEMLAQIKRRSDQMSKGSVREVYLRKALGVQVVITVEQLDNIKTERSGKYTPPFQWQGLSLPTNPDMSTEVLKVG